MLTVVHDADEANGNEAGGRSLLDEIVRDGARQMLAVRARGRRPPRVRHPVSPTISRQGGVRR